MRRLSGLVLAGVFLSAAPASAFDWTQFFSNNPVSKDAIVPQTIDPNIVGTPNKATPSAPIESPGPISCATTFNPFFNKMVYSDPRATDAICGNSNSASRNVPSAVPNANVNRNLDLSGLCENGVMSIQTLSGQIERRPCVTGGNKQTLTQPTQRETTKPAQKETTRPAYKEVPTATPSSQARTNTVPNSGSSSEDSTYMLGDTVEQAIRGELPTEPQQPPVRPRIQSPRMPSYSQNVNCAQLQMRFRRAIANTGYSIDPDLQRSGALLDQYCGGAR